MDQRNVMEVRGWINVVQDVNRLEEGGGGGADVDKVMTIRVS